MKDYNKAIADAARAWRHARRNNALECTEESDKELKEAYAKLDWMLYNWNPDEYVPED